MSTFDNNPVYFIEEDQKTTTATTYRSKNQALLNKATQQGWKHKNIIRITILVILLIIAITCGALIHAFASTHEQAGQSAAELTYKTAITEQVTVDIIKGDTLWSIANQHAPGNVSVKSYIHKIMELNGLTEPVIQEGHLLLLP